MYKDGKKVDGNKAAMGGNEPTFRTKMMGGGKATMKRKGYRMGGSCQPVYSGDIPKAKAN